MLDDSLSDPSPVEKNASASEGKGEALASGRGETLESLENIDFLLEEIEDKIAPLALA